MATSTAIPTPAEVEASRIARSRAETEIRGGLPWSVMVADAERRAQQQ